MRDVVMEVYVQQILNGVVLGSIYALIALGYTMVYGIMGLINFAHGEVVMVGAMVSVTILTVLIGMGIALPGPALLLMALMVAIPACMLLGYSIEKVAYRRLRKAPRLAPLITAIGLSMILQQLTVFIWGDHYIPFPQILDHGLLHIAGGVITKLQLLIILLSLFLMFLLYLLVEKTKLGRAMRAVSQNPSVASLMGVNVNAIISATFMCGSALGAIAGVLVAANYDQAHYMMGFMIGLKAFVAAVLGGIGNIRGAVAGGFLLGLLENVGIYQVSRMTNDVIGSNYIDVVAFIVLIAVLIFRPSGLLGEKQADRA
jgi:branched-chain amino acid transport system permease protein